MGSPMVSTGILNPGPKIKIARISVKLQGDLSARANPTILIQATANKLKRASRLRSQKILSKSTEIEPGDRILAIEPRRDRVLKPCGGKPLRRFCAKNVPMQPLYFSQYSEPRVSRSIPKSRFQQMLPTHVPAHKVRSTDNARTRQIAAEMGGERFNCPFGDKSPLSLKVFWQTRTYSNH